MEVPGDNTSAATAEQTSDLTYFYPKRNSPVNSVRSTPSSPLSRKNAVASPHALNCRMYEVGRFYEIDHTQLLPKYPIHLKDVRVVKVTEKTRLNITVSFPSAFSLRKYFVEKFHPGEQSSHPDLDEQFVMGFDRAMRILKREIPMADVEREMRRDSFWLMTRSDEIVCNDFAEEEDRKEVCADSCLVILKKSGAFNWGVRRKVKYFGRHRDEISSLGTVVKEEETAGGKRAREIPQKKTMKEETRNKKSKPEKGRTSDRKGVKTTKDRWSLERYRAAETKLLQIMKEKGAELGNPILRPKLREEARKHIGDTGLLDHLLKHMAGKVVHGGKERFCRRHNPEGAMEYWLEAAELQELRMSAGFMDPFWLPPLGWKPDDSLCGVVCGKEIVALKEELAFLRREIDWVRAVKQEQLHGQTRSHSSSVHELQESYESLTKANTKLGNQVIEIAKRLQVMQAELQEVKSDKERKEAEERTKASKGNKMARRSGFRICKPQGTFMWPSTGGEHSVGLPLTPHSASSSTSPPPLPIIDVSSVDAPRVQVVVLAPRPQMLAGERTDSSDNVCFSVLSSPKKGLAGPSCGGERAAWEERGGGWSSAVSTDLALSSPCYLR